MEGRDNVSSRLDTRKNFFSGVVRQWHSCPGRRAVTITGGLQEL